MRLEREQHASGSGRPWSGLPIALADRSGFQSSESSKRFVARPGITNRSGLASYRTSESEWSGGVPSLSHGGILVSEDELIARARASLLEQLEGLSEGDWDCEGARAIDRSTLEEARDFLIDALRFLPYPEVAPASDGTICMEWHWHAGSRRTKVFVDFGPGTKVVAFGEFEDGSTEEEHFGSLSSDAQRFIRHLFDRGTRILAD